MFNNLLASPNVGLMHYLESHCNLSYSSSRTLFVTKLECYPIHSHFSYKFHSDDSCPSLLSSRGTRPLTILTHFHFSYRFHNVIHPTNTAIKSSPLREKKSPPQRLRREATSPQSRHLLILCRYPYSRPELT